MIDLPPVDITICVVATHGQLGHVRPAIAQLAGNAGIVVMTGTDQLTLYAFDASMSKPVRILLSEPMVAGPDYMHANMSNLTRDLRKIGVCVDFWLMVGACAVAPTNAAVPGDLLIPNKAYRHDDHGGPDEPLSPSDSFMNMVRTADFSFAPQTMEPLDFDVFLRYIFSRDRTGRVSGELQDRNRQWLVANGFPDSGPTLRGHLVDRYMKCLTDARDQEYAVWIDPHGTVPSLKTIDNIQGKLLAGQEFPETISFTPKAVVAECATTRAVVVGTGVFDKSRNHYRFPVGNDLEVAAFLQSLKDSKSCYGAILDVFRICTDHDTALRHHASSAALQHLIGTYVANCIG